MKMNKRGLIALAAVFGVFLLCALGCKKDDDEEYLYLDGALRIVLDPFLAPFTTVELEPSGVSHPEGGEIEYIWTVTPAVGDVYRDTVYTFVYTFSDTLQTYTVACSARADDYVSTSGSAVTQVVVGGLDGNGSLTDGSGKAVVNLAQLSYMMDARDSVIYYYTGFNGYDWFIQNLEYRGDDGSMGMAYKDCDVANDVFGAFYSYSEAVKACPDGWKLPTSDEWDASMTFDSGSLMANIYFNGDRMWEFWPAVDISNYSYFTGIPMGDVNLTAKSFDGYGSRAVFWTATEYEDDSAKGVVKYFMDDQPILYEAIVDKVSFGANVRCIRTGKSDIPF
ncbi:MAG: fibrobacter succinogenes major paralogous domain-containing protein [Bacteroidales bacterium]|nr:fibrobacter succinogenes major paralogous domain-containing protein [Bacteroidales bacterium]